MFFFAAERYLFSLTIMDEDEKVSNVALSSSDSAGVAELSSKSLFFYLQKKGTQQIIVKL